MASTSLRLRVYEILESAPNAGALARSVNIFLVALILLNVTANIMASVDWLYARYSNHFFLFELVSVLIFTAEYLCRLWACADSPDARYRHPLTGRLRYALTPMLIIDLLAILPFFLMLWTTLDLMFLRVFRLFRIFKLTRYSPAMGMLLTVLRNEAKSFGAAMFILFVIMIFAASGIYLVEREVQPEAFGSIPAAMWWAMTTLTTVGYGDVTPVTSAGRVFGACITIVGVGMVALPAGILASAFSDELHKRRAEYSRAVDAALLDGQLTQEERTTLDQTRSALGIDKAAAEKILEQAGHTAGRTCPHCGAPLDG